MPEAVDALVTSMLAKDPAARPSAEAVYAALLPFALASPPDDVTDAARDAADQDRDPTRPFRRPLLAAPTRPAETAAEQALLTDTEAKLLLGNVEALLQAEHTAEASATCFCGPASPWSGYGPGLRLKTWTSAVPSPTRSVPRSRAR